MTWGIFPAVGTTAANVNLVAQVALVLALTAGAILARQKRFRAHKFVESGAVLSNLVMIGIVMLPSLRNPGAAARPYRLQASLLCFYHRTRASGHGGRVDGSLRCPGLWDRPAAAASSTSKSETLDARQTGSMVVGRGPRHRHLPRLVRGALAKHESRLSPEWPRADSSLGQRKRGPG